MENIGTFMENVFPYVFIIIFIGVLIFFIYNFIITCNPKLRGKWMAKSVKSMKHMLDESKDDLINISSTLGDVSAQSGKKILDNNEDILRNVATRKAHIDKESIKIKTRAIKEGLSEEENFIYCRHCGIKVDGDSTFCKSCGKKV